MPSSRRSTGLAQASGLNMRLIKEGQHTVSGMLIICLYKEDIFKELLSKVEEILWRMYSKVYGWTAGVEVTTVFLHNVLVQADLLGILEVLGKQGEVLGHTIHRYKELPHVRNSIVSVRMKLGAKASIHAFIYNEAPNFTVQMNLQCHYPTPEQNQRRLGLAGGDGGGRERKRKGSQLQENPVKSQ